MAFELSVCTSMGFNDATYLGPGFYQIDALRKGTDSNFCSSAWGVVLLHQLSLDVVDHDFAGPTVQNGKIIGYGCGMDGCCIACPRVSETRWQFRLKNR